MSARRSVAVAGVVTGLVAGALGLAGCRPGGGAGAAAPPPVAVTTQAAGSTAPPVQAVPDAPSSRTPTPKTQPSDDAPGMDCSTPALAPGHHVVVPRARPTQGVMFARVGEYVCDPNDGHYRAGGAEQTYQFAPEVKAELAGEGGAPQSALVGDLWTHIGDCLSGGADVQAPLSCSAYPAYEITQNSAGRITAIRELWHS
ncbi:hypothetical protein [Kitasatospora sp. McL0602]|uniref:hypothetical protein n=1 Tax=Kitasatospora sp. McL0602 TaxID=3439530 RepID=UPI003F8C1E4E